MWQNAWLCLENPLIQTPNPIHLTVKIYWLAVKNRLAQWHLPRLDFSLEETKSPNLRYEYNRLLKQKSVVNSRLKPDQIDR